MFLYEPIDTSLCASPHDFAGGALSLARSGVSTEVGSSRCGQGRGPQNGSPPRPSSALQQRLRTVDPDLTAADMARAVARQEQHELGDLGSLARRATGEWDLPSRKLYWNSSALQV